MRSMPFAFLACIAASAYSQTMPPQPLPERWKSPTDEFLMDHVLLDRPSRFLAIGEYGTVLQCHGWSWITEDPITWGITWDERRSAGNTYKASRAIAGSGDKFMVLDNPDGSDGAPWFASSTDGTEWTSAPSGIKGWLQDLAVDDRSKTWVAVGSRSVPWDETPTRENVQAQIQVSKDDGATWEEVRLGYGVRLRGVHTNGSLWVAVGGNNKSSAIYTSTDAIHWDAVSSTSKNALNGIDYIHGNWVAVGDYSMEAPSPAILRSSDGSQWEDVSPVGIEHGLLFDVAATAQGYLAVGTGLALHSYDGKDWSRLYEDFHSSVRSIKTVIHNDHETYLSMVADTGVALVDSLIERRPPSNVARSIAAGWSLQGNQLLAPAGFTGTVDILHRKPDGQLVESERIHSMGSNAIALPHPGRLHLVQVFAEGMLVFSRMRTGF